MYPVSAPVSQHTNTKARPSSFFLIIIVSALTASFAIAVDTNFYQPTTFSLDILLKTPTITPINNLLYNAETSNLAEHGLHPLYQHFLVNLPQLLGPAFPLLLFTPRYGKRLYSALTGCAILSLFPHQEARFLLPAVPLFLSSIRLPKRQPQAWMAIWMAFNIVLGLIMGVFHQGGVVPAQMHVGSSDGGSGFENVQTVIWWETYPPPTWLLGHRGLDQTMINVVDLMGAARQTAADTIALSTVCGDQGATRQSQIARTLVIAPRSAHIPALAQESNAISEPDGKRIEMKETWTYSRHLTLDNMDWAEDGVWGTLTKLITQRGISIYQATAVCN